MSLTGKPNLTTLANIENDGFWPDLALGDLINQYRIPPEYADDVIKTGLIMAMVRTNEQLYSAKLGFLALGFSTLLAYTTAHNNPVNTQPVLFLHYKNAVFCRAKAMLLQQFNSLNRKPEAENAAKESDNTEQYWLDEAQASLHAIYLQVLPEQFIPGKSGFYAALL